MLDIADQALTLKHSVVKEEIKNLLRICSNPIVNVFFFSTLEFRVLNAADEY